MSALLTMPQPATLAEEVTNEWLEKYVNAANSAGLWVEDTERMTIKATIYGAVSATILKLQKQIAHEVVDISRDWAAEHARTCGSCENTCLEMGADIEHFLIHEEKRK